MKEIYLCIGICVIIWVVNGKWIIQAIKEHVTSEFFMHIGLGVFFTLLTLGIFFGKLNVLIHFDIPWLEVVGFILYIPAAVLVFGSIHQLSHKGKPGKGDPTATTTFINTGIYGIIRQPMTLGMAIWSIALIFVFQSIIPIILGLISIYCFWMAARKEAEYNIKKFGVEYREYMKQVPLWNVFKGVRRSFFIPRSK